MAAPHPDELLNVAAHRPWPVPERPWIMQQSWYDVLFAHWPLPLAALRPHVPPQLPIDQWEGSAWLGIVPFEVRNARPRGLPGVPSATHFLEANLRTYVTLDGKPGVYFFSLDAASALAVLGARTFFRLPYHEAEMSCERSAGRVHYRSRRIAEPTAALECTYRGLGNPAAPAPGTLEHFLTERYCLYTAKSGAGAARMDIHHPPWPLERAECTFMRNTLATAQGIDGLEATPPVLHYAAEQHVLIWPPSPSDLPFP